jgi:hypothetical protein
MSLGNFVTDAAILDVPAGIRPELAAQWLGVPVERVIKVRERAEPKPRQRADLPPIGGDSTRASASAAAGCMRLLRAQLRHGQHDITDPAALATIKRFAGIP